MPVMRSSPRPATKISAASGASEVVGAVAADERARWLKSPPKTT
jgi:hypothetical protein